MNINNKKPIEKINKQQKKCVYISTYGKQKTDSRIGKAIEKRDLEEEYNILM